MRGREKFWMTNELSTPTSYGMYKSEDDISIWDTQIAKYVNEAKIKMWCHWTLSNREKKKKKS